MNSRAYPPYKITGTFTNGSFICTLSVGNKTCTYGQSDKIGKGSYGTAYLLKPLAANFASYPALVGKAVGLQKKYPMSSSSKDIERVIKTYFAKAQYEADMNKLVDGIGACIKFNATGPFQTSITTEDEKQYQVLETVPRAFIVMEKKEGTILEDFSIQSATQYREFCIAAIRSLKKLHDKFLVHSDVREGNMLVEVQDSKLKVHFIDRGVCGHEGTAIPPDVFGFDLIAPEIENRACHSRDSAQDIYNLGIVFTDKYRDCFLDHVYFSLELRIQIERLIKEMTATDPQDRPHCAEIFNRLKEIKKLSNSHEQETEKFNTWCKEQLSSIVLPDPDLETAEQLKQYVIANYATNLIQALITIPNLTDRYIMLHHLTNDNPYLAQLFDFNVEEFVSVWDGDELLQNNAMQLLFRSQLKKVAPDEANDADINQYLYCKQVIVRLEHGEKISGAIACYHKLQANSLETGRGANRYLQLYVTKAKYFETCLKELSLNNDAYHTYLFQYGDSKNLAKLVDADNLLDLFDVTTKRNFKMLLDKLEPEYLDEIIDRIKSKNYSGDELRKYKGVMDVYRGMHRIIDFNDDDDVVGSLSKSPTVSTLFNQKYSPSPTPTSEVKRTGSLRMSLSSEAE